MRYLLDTDICVEVMRGRGSGIFERMRNCPAKSVGISSITLAELEYGATKSQRPQNNRIALAKFCAPLEIHAFDADAAAFYGSVRTELERLGQTIGPLDTLIAAHGLALGAVLVTNNEREFRRVRGLEVANWAR